MPALRRVPRSEIKSDLIEGYFDLLSGRRVDPIDTPGDWLSVFAQTPDIFRHDVIARALRLEFDDREDPIVEVAAPEGFAAQDFLSAPRPAASR